MQADVKSRLREVASSVFRELQRAGPPPPASSSEPRPPPEGIQGGPIPRST
jgi:hypothetical protein